MKKLEFEKPVFKKYKGMRINISNPKRFKARESRYALETLEGNLKIMAERFYNGDIAVVDEFFQVYCMSKEIERSE